MRNRLSSVSRPVLATGCAVLMAALILGAALVWYLPAVTTPSQPVAEVPAPPALFGVTEFTVGPRQRACEHSVTVTPLSQIAEFTVRPAAGATAGPPLRFTLDAPGYHSSVAVGGGYPGGTASLPISAPGHSLIATACFVNTGSTPLVLVGTSEPRTVSRASPVVVGGKAVEADVGLTFKENRSVGVAHLLGQLVAHASNLTDGLVPPPLVWVIGLLTMFGVPLATIVAVWLSLKDDQPAQASRTEYSDV